VKKQTSRIAASRTFSHYCRTEYLVLCNEVIVGQDNSASIIRVLDQIVVFAFPLQIHRLGIIAQFSRNETISTEEYGQAELTHKLVLITPEGKEFDLWQFTISPNAPAVGRAITDLSGQIWLYTPGFYEFRLLGKTQNTEFEELAVKRIPAFLSVGLPGIYAAEYSAAETKSRDDEVGTAMVALFPDGTLKGVDYGFQYDGHYKYADDGSLVATMRIQRLQKDAVSVFGDVDTLDLSLKGTEKSPGEIVLSGSPEGRPDDKIWVSLTRQTLMPSAPAQPEASELGTQL